MRTFYIFCSLVTILTNLVLITLFKPLRAHLVGAAWFCIIVAFFLMVGNSLIIGYLVIERPTRPLSVILIASFFVLRAIKNILWLIGFWIQYKNFTQLENAEKDLAKYVSSDKHKIIKEDVGLAESLVEDLENK